MSGKLKCLISSNYHGDESLLTNICDQVVQDMIGILRSSQIREDYIKLVRNALSLQSMNHVSPLVQSLLTPAARRSKTQ
jgi:hypothetical protein